MARGKKKTELTRTEACCKLLLEIEQDLELALEGDPAPGEENRATELRAEWSHAKEKGRTALDFDSWRSDLVTQIGASWVLSCVFVRFVEDNDLVDRPWISGPVHEDPARDRGQRAKETERVYYAKQLHHGARDYLKFAFRELAKLPGLDGLLDERHALLWRLTPTNDGTRVLVDFFRQLDDATGNLWWDFTDPELDTRFLGDLYQDLSESARKTYALLQTPTFVESFILDRTLERAIETFGLAEVRMIDPTCGSGHFLLGSFNRLFRHWQRAEPGTNATELARRALDAVHGVDLNPFAAAIARFRLLVAALRACGATRLAHAPRFPIHVAVGDSLLHGRRFADLRGPQREMWDDPFAHLYPHEQDPELRAILSRQYHAVVGNPPYITPKDAALNRAYRAYYGSCNGKYALSVPFMERFVELAVSGRSGPAAGYVGKITSNSFIKRDFGEKLIEEYFSGWDLTHIIDTSGAYIPGHGTPTVVLLLRNQAPASPRIRAVLGIRGEPSTPAEPSKGLVWSAIVDQVDHAGSEGKFVSVEDIERAEFKEHPWCLGGGGARDLLKDLKVRAEQQLGKLVDSIGITCFTLEDDVFLRPPDAILRLHPPVRSCPMVEGDSIRDWTFTEKDHALFPYDDSLIYEATIADHPVGVALWPFRATLQNNKLFGSRRKAEGGIGDFEYGRFTSTKLRTSLSIAFAFVATHNHFILDRGGKVFNRSAPVVKLPSKATEDDHFALLAILNSSTACFWGRQTLFCKGSTVDQRGARQTTVPFEDFYEWDSTKLLCFPLVEHAQSGRAARLDQLAGELEERSPRIQCRQWKAESGISYAEEAWVALLQRMIAEQEELDWALYDAYGLTEVRLAYEPIDQVPALALGERAFEVHLARRVAAGELETRWFERHGSTPVTELPGRWPEAYRRLVERRIELIEGDRNIGLLEQPEYKRRWNVEPWDNQVQSALGGALLDRIEALPQWKAVQPIPLTVARLAELLEGDERFLALLRLRSGEAAPEVERAVATLVEGESVPFLPARYLKPTGLKKRKRWEETWGLQRIEDPFLKKQEALLRDHFGASPAEQKRARAHVACWLTSAKLSKERHLTDEELEALKRLRDDWRAIDTERRAAIGGATPHVPPKYDTKDFLGNAWSLRGKLDVSKERFVSYPHCSPEGDPTPLIGWAGWDHAQRAAALAQMLQARKGEGWTGERLAPILQGLDQLVFWLFQWHGEDHGKQYQQFVESETLAAGLTSEQVRGWRPPEMARRRGRSKKEREEPVSEGAEAE